MSAQHKQGVIESKFKQTDHEHVQFLKNLSSTQQGMLRTNPI